jgi:hypothetical protein
MMAALPSTAKIAELLGGEVRGNQICAPGPGHSAGDRSLSVLVEASAPDGFVVNSFAGDDAIACRDHVRKMLGLPEPPKTKAAKWEVLGEYVYYDQNGERYLKVRKCRDGTGKKQYPQYHWDGNDWVKGKPSGPKIPYRLPQLIATPVTALVYFCEGEKDADNLAKISFVATTVSEGAAAKWDAVLTPFFKDRHVVILADADRPGRLHAQKVAKAIYGVAASVRILDLYPERHDGSDVSDYIAHDTAGARLAEAVKNAPLWAPSGPTTGPSTAAGGAALLADVYGFLGRFVAYPSVHAHVAHALWNAHTHAMEAWDSTPRIAFLSAEPGSGKTRALEVSELLVPNPVEAVNVTPAYLFRKVGAEEGPPTILYDEIDTVFGPKARDNEEIRGLLNAGHRRGAVAGRCVVRGKTVETEEIPAYCAVALAGLGWLPDTLMSRSIVIRMRRRGPSESVEPYRRRDEIDEGHALRDRLAGWTAAQAKILYAARPAMPPGIEDRNADVWEALFAVADAAGGDWPKLAREAAVALIAASREQEPSLGIRLLADLRTVCGNTEAVFTETILAGLHALDEAPWKDLNNGKGLDSRGLSLRLRQYGIKPKQIREGSISKKGYQRADLADAWARYLPSSPASETSETAETTEHFQAPRVSVVSDEAPNVSDRALNASFNGGPKQPMKSTSVSAVSDVSLVADAAFANVSASDVADVSDAGRRNDQADDIPADQTCAQCNGAIDGTERMVSVSGHTVWLHETCERFWSGFVVGER